MGLGFLQKIAPLGSIALVGFGEGEIAAPGAEQLQMATLWGAWESGRQP